MKTTMKVMTMIAGCLMVLAGMGCVILPMTTVLVIGKMVGALLLIWGIESLISCIREKKSFWKGFLSVAVLIGGCCIFLNGFQALMVVDVLAKVFASFALLAGITQIIFAVSERESVFGWWMMVLNGLLTAFLAVLVLSNPLTGFIVADCLVGMELVMAGIMMISFCFVKKEIHVETEEFAEEM